MRLFALVKIPLIFFCRPTIIKIDETECVVRLPFRRRTKNHVGSMYFGALSVGADLCIGLLAMHQIDLSKQKVVLIFKDFKADYKKLALGDVHFVSQEGAKVKALVARAIQTKERQNETIYGYAVVPSVNPEEKIMEFWLTLSLKAKSA